jgi:hypothetical protein
MDRRSFLSLVAGCITWPTMAHAVSRPPLALRRLRLVNAHIGETFDGAYRDDKTPIEGVIADADGSASENYRPSATPGKYVPTILPIALTVAQRRPWLLDVKARCSRQNPARLPYSNSDSMFMLRMPRTGCADPLR